MHLNRTCYHGDGYHGDGYHGDGYQTTHVVVYQADRWQEGMQLAVVIPKMQDKETLVSLTSNPFQYASTKTWEISVVYTSLEYRIVSNIGARQK